MSNFFEEVKAAVIDDAALSQGDTSQCSCSVSPGLSPISPYPGRGLRQLLRPSWPALKPSAWLPTVCLSLPAPPPAAPLLTSLPSPLVYDLPSLSLLTACSTWAPCFPLSLRAQPSPTCPPSPASSPPHLPVPPLNPCGLMVQTGHNSSDSTWLSNYFMSHF